MNKRLITFLFLVMLSFGSVLFLLSENESTYQSNVLIADPTTAPKTPSPTPFQLINVPREKRLPGNYHVFQTFNNCGPAALSMALSHYGISKSQDELGKSLRPYQNPQGDNDDKSVTLEEVAEKSKEYGFTPYLRPNGSIDKIKLFIAYDMPVITRTWLKENDDIGHYRVIKGYDDTTQQILQDDSLQGNNLSYSYTSFNILWEKYNYEYLVLVPENKIQIAEAILGEDLDEQRAWEKAVTNARNELVQNPNNIYAGFNLSVALHNIGNYKESILEYEKVDEKLPFRTLWYQIEPIESYVALGEDAKVLTLTEQILNRHNRAFSELYIIRGNIYKKQGNTARAREEYQKAVLYNQNLSAAKEALASL